MEIKLKKQTFYRSIKVHYSNFLFAFLIIVLPSLGIAQEERSLIANSLSQLRSISPETPIKERLDKYSQVIQNVDEIERRYPSTEVGLTLLSTGRFGDFDFNNVRESYIRELSAYFDKICDVSPSLNCLGFVSLKSAAEQCGNLSSIAQATSSTVALQNSAKIFGGQKSGVQYVPLVITVFRSCRNTVGGKFGLVAKDRVSLELITTLLNLGDVGRATGLAQQISTPYFKFEAAIALKKKSGERIDSTYLERLLQFTNTIGGVNNSIARLSLGNLALSIDSPLVDSKTIYNYSSFIQQYDAQTLTCNDGVQEEYFNLLANYMFKVGALKPNLNLDSHKTNLFGNSILRDLNDPVRSALFQRCQKNYLVALKSMSLLMAANRKEQAKSFYDRFNQAGSDLSKLTLIEMYLEMLPYRGITNPSKPDSIDVLIGLVRIDLLAFQYERNETQFALFKKQVDRGEVCNAAFVLFKNLKGSPYFDSAINYISRSDLPLSTKQSCGDEDLELLLR